MGEDQHPAGSRGLDEPQRRDGLAGSGRVLEPEPLGGVGVLRLLFELAVLALALPVLRLFVLGLGLVEVDLLLVVVLVVLLVVLFRVGVRSDPSGRRRRVALPGERPIARRRAVGGCAAGRWFSARSAVRVPERASTWCAERTVPSTRRGSSSESRRSRPSSSENRRRQSTDGRVFPCSTSARAASSAWRRADPGASASSSVSPS
jgi:hypothetical protein